MGLAQPLRQLRDAEPAVIAQQEENREAARWQIDPGAAIDLIDAGIEGLADLAQPRAEKERAVVVQRCHAVAGRSSSEAPNYIRKCLRIANPARFPLSSCRLPGLPESRFECHDESVRF